MNPPTTDVITDVHAQGLTRALAEQARTLTFADIPEAGPAQGRVSAYRIMSPAVLRGAS